MEAKTITSLFENHVADRSALDGVLDRIERFVAPFRGEFYRSISSDNNITWTTADVWDTTAIVGVKSLASKVYGSVIPPSVKWFALRFRDDDLNETGAAKEWLEDTENRVWQALKESDFDTEAAETLYDMTSFGTSFLFFEESDDLTFDGFDFTAWPISDTYFETDHRGRANRIFRRLRYTDQQLVDRFDHSIDESSKDVSKKHEVIFCVYRREEVPLQPDGPRSPELRPWGCKYVLVNDGTVLEEGGYYHFPCLVSRWDKVAGSSWGTGPGAIILPDVQVLNAFVAQYYESRAKAIDRPMFVTTENIVGDYDIRPGGLITVEDINGIRDMPDVSPFNKEEATLNRLVNAIRSALFLDKLELKESPAMTATEVMARQEEMARFMAPTLGRIKTDLLNPMIEAMVMSMLRTGGLMEPPEELQNVELDIEYTSPLPRAEHAEQATSMMAWVQEALAMIQIDPQILDRVDLDAYLIETAQLRGVPAGILRDDEEVEALRVERAERQKAAENLAMMQAQASTLKTAGEAQQEMAAGEAAGGGNVMPMQR